MKDRIIVIVMLFIFALMTHPQRRAYANPVWGSLRRLTRQRRQPAGV